MIRIIAFLVVVVLLGAGFSWLADRPGELFIIWQGQRVEMTLMVAAVLVVGLIAIVMFGWWIVRSIWTSPQSISRYFRARKRDRGYQALSTGLIAVGSGDAPLARKMLDRTKGLLRAETEPLVLLLDAQSCLIEGRTDEARQKFEKMAEDPETRELGLRGLYLEAMRLGAHEAARHYAEKAVEKAPHLPWAAEATLEYRVQAGRFDDAIRLLETQRVLNGMDRKLHDRKKAVLLTGRGLSKFETDPKGSREDAVHALKLDPTLIPAATLAAKAYLRENNLRKAQNVLEAAYKLNPQMELATAYAHAGGGTSLERLRRTEKLEAMRPDAYETLYTVAAAALDARDFIKARAKAEMAARIDSRESIYLLMADIEEAQTGDQGRVRYWLAQALRAERDPEWVADGQVSAHWLPVSPISGRLDAFEWKKAYAPAAGRLEDGTAATAADAFGALPDISSPAVDAEEPEIPTPAATIPAVEPVTAPTKPATVAPLEAAVEPVPFFGRPPDDPGVKKQTAETPSNGFKLF
ncbi:MAG: hypothetical protein RLZZ444_1696 [Pseudomonadota bacterium]